jgi:hypothetical protein
MASSGEMDALHWSKKVQVSAYLQGSIEWPNIAG